MPQGALLTPSFLLSKPYSLSKAIRCNTNERTVGDFLLRGWQMLMLTVQEEDYSEFRRWTSASISASISACISWPPWQQNHSQSQPHKSPIHILAQFESGSFERGWCKNGHCDMCVHKTNILWKQEEHAPFVIMWSIEVDFYLWSSTSTFSSVNIS